MLDAIVERKRRDLTERRNSEGLESTLSRCRPSRRSLQRALARGRPGFILELKHASPSAGSILDRSRTRRILDAYAPHADAVSVVTDGPFFGGSLRDLALARERTEAPLLCKDIVVDPHQVAEARLHGADAVLLILAILDDAAWRACADLAEQLGLDVITEVHDETETRRAVSLGAQVIGINSRDLRTFSVDTRIVQRLSRLVPDDRLVVAESGIQSRADAETLSPHADAFLVGTSVLRDPEPDHAVRRLVYGTTKICGLTTAREAAAAWEAGATHGGLVFAPGSPRLIKKESALALRSAVPLHWVGVFVDEEPARIARYARKLNLNTVQFHGSRSQEKIAELRSLLPDGCGIWKAVQVRERIPEHSLDGADRILLDRWEQGRDGGTGRAFDWALLEDHPLRSRVILAGGLTPDNVARAAATGVAGLDVSSGVENAPGRKDLGLIRSFLRARRRLPGRREITK